MIVNEIHLSLYACLCMCQVYESVDFHAHVCVYVCVYHHICVVLHVLVVCVHTIVYVYIY